MVWGIKCRSRVSILLVSEGESDKNTISTNISWYETAGALNVFFQIAEANGTNESNNNYNIREVMKLFIINNNFYKWRDENNKQFDKRKIF